jgi:hypothetical protein
MDYQQREAFKKKATIAGVSILAGGAAWWILLASVFGWVSPTTARQRMSDAVQTKVDQVLAPFCADRFMANKAALAKFVKASESYDRDEIVQNAIPKIGSTTVDYQLSDNCATAIQAQLKSQAQLKKALPAATQVNAKKS